MFHVACVKGSAISTSIGQRLRSRDHAKLRHNMACNSTEQKSSNLFLKIPKGPMEDDCQL